MSKKTIPIYLALFLVVAAGCSRQKIDRETAGIMITASRVWVEPFTSTIYGMTDPPGGSPYPAARRALLGVSGVAMEGDGKRAIADFRWKWTGIDPPLGDREFEGRAGFRLYDDGWRLNEDDVLRASLRAPGE